MLTKRGEVLGSAISLVLGQSILRIDLVELFHPAVAIHFCQNGGRGNRGGAHIAVDQGFLLDGEVELDGVEQQVIGERMKLRDCGDHGLAAGLIDVPGIDAARIYFGDGPGQRVLAYAFGENESPFGIDFLGIIEADDSASGAEDYRCGYHRAKQRTAAGFVESGNTQPAALARFAFVTPRAEPFHVRAF